MSGLIKAALLFKILVVQGSVFRAEKYLQDVNHIERYKSTYSDFGSDDFGDALNTFDVGRMEFMPRYQHGHFLNRKIIPDWFAKPANPELMGPVGPIEPLGPIRPTWPSSNGQGRIGFPARRNPNNNRRNKMCKNLKGLPTPESGCCGVEEPRFPIHQQNLGYPNGPFWPEPWNERNRRSTDSDEPPHKMIRGGRATDLHQLPWTVRLAINPRLKGLHSPDYCGGTIVSSRYVLTAAHCLYNTFKDISQLEVFLAEYDTDTYPEDCITSNGIKECIHNIVKKVEHVIIHKDYNDTYLQNDVALLRLSSDIPYTDFIRPICLPTEDVADIKGENIIIAGWGMNGKKETNVKQAANVNYVSNDKCKEQYSYKDDSMFCSIGDHGEDICHGDSGGPLMVLSKKKYLLLGVVSGKRGDHECGSSVSSLFNNVFYHKDWITKHVT
ncbi:CLIP domain-containing serine protease B9-like [Cydia fagiglandana]|uniref:CLIP domain-containing serine protease B9-like n=1 Tax=Cydia fagiglandana TaxID=1458189 RepID=UPI002FEE1676